MPRYIIERDVPGAGDLSRDELKAISQASCDVLDQLGPHIQWQHSYVTSSRLYCVYSAPGEDVIREHASLGKFPANRISEVTAMIGPVTAGQA